MMTNDKYDYCLVLVTAASEVEGATIAKSLLTEKLAACVNIAPVQSFYTWQGEMQQDQEWQLLIKTRYSLVERLTVRVQRLHSYDVPEIVALPILAGSSAYLNWISENTQADQ